MTNDEKQAEVARLREALRNVLLLTMQRRPYMPADVSDKLLRFCREGGEAPTILRMPVDPDADARFAAEKVADPPFRKRVPLSLRVRPDSEVSRWVYDDIVKQERDAEWRVSVLQAEIDTLRGTHCGEWTEVDNERVQRSPCGVCLKCREATAVDQALGEFYFLLKGALPREVQQTLNRVTDEVRASRKLV